MCCVSSSVGKLIFLLESMTWPGVHAYRFISDKSSCRCSRRRKHAVHHQSEHHTAAHFEIL